MKPNAFQCHIFPCVRTYEASISKLVLEEEVVSEIPMGIDRFGGNGRYVLAASNLTQHGEKTVNCTPHPANDTAGLVLVALANVDSAPREPRSPGSQAPGAWYPEECVWVLGESPFRAIRPELRSYLEGASIQGYDNTYIGSIVAKNLWRNATISFGSVDTFMRNLTYVMTATMRNNGANGAADYIIGKVVLDITCIDVRWARLSFPVALVVEVVQPSIRQETDLSWFRDEIEDVARVSWTQLAQDGAGKATLERE
ncbi:hypothetical protein GQX73_g634 [Xylaria multiplex]|uniref:Uncharacterized protein n=1 Tax=Xylaria multiplex TaxID=323545 RepID=A0A7C8N4K5_9PEZI|nr:hypothetical protein GQX73_g634 [Xylaria multiplex]